MRKSFTLIELLVVVAIIAVLVSILLPALGKARRLAQTAVCCSNLRQMGLAINMYGAENGDAMVPILERHWGDPIVNGLAGGGRGWTWAGILKETSNIPMEGFRCPSDSRIYDVDETSFLVPVWPGEDFGPFSYGALFAGYGLSNRRVPGTTPFTPCIPSHNQGLFSLSRIPDPATMILIWDGHIAIFSNGGGMIPLVQDLIEYRDFWADTVFRHNSSRTDMERGPNVVYADGHVGQTINVVPPIT